MLNFDDFDFAVKALTGGKNAVILDEIGMPSVMVALPKLDSHDLCGDLEPGTHPAWLRGSRELDTVYLSKFQNVVYQDRAYSLPLLAPAAAIDFDSALSACRQKGQDWGLTPAALWSAVALWSKKNGTMPRGNNDYGSDFHHPEERGAAKTFSSLAPAKVYHTAAGSGPLTWNHNWRDDGICDLNGNVSEWQAGLRLCFGELQIIKNADCMDHSVSLAADSEDWQALDRENRLISPGLAASVKLDFLDGVWAWIDGERFASRVNTARYCEFKAMGQRLSPLPRRLKELTLFPADPDLSGYGGEYLYASNGSPESMLIRGGSFASNFIAGLFCSGLNIARYNKSRHFGFRSAYYGKP